MEMLPVLRAAAGPPGALRIGAPAPQGPQQAAGSAAGGSQPSSQQQRQEEADADLANQIQAQLNAKEARGGQQSRYSQSCNHYPHGCKSGCLGQPCSDMLASTGITAECLKHAVSKVSKASHKLCLTQCSQV